MKKYFIFSLLLVLPLLFIYTGSILTEAKGPYWMGPNQDPEYQYLFNSLNVATLRKIGHTDHPGTPVQVLGAIVLRAANIRWSNTDFAENVIVNSEFYLSLINKFFMSINFIALLGTGILGYLATRDITLSLVMQASPFFFITTLDYGLTRVSPEPLLLFTSLLFSLCLLIYIHAESRSSLSEPVSVSDNFFTRFNKHSFSLAVFSFLSGFGMATKVTFLPLTIIPLFVLPSLQSRIRYVLGTALSFIFFTLPIITQYKKMFGWLYSIFSHSGRYGHGSNIIIDPDSFLANLITVLNHNRLFLVILLASFAVVSVNILLFGYKRCFTNRKIKLLSAITVSHLLALLIVAKHVGLHYLLPSLSLSGITLTLCILNAKDIMQARGLRTHWLKMITFLILASVCLVQAQTVRNVQSAYADTKNELLKIYVKNESDCKDCARIYFYTSTSPLFALNFGSEYSHRKFSQILSSRYNKVYFYNIWNKTFYNWKEPVELQDILKANKKTILQGATFENESARFRPDIPLKAIYSVKGETIYTVDSRLQNGGQGRRSP